MARHAGIILPLFSAPSSRSWGIGEIGDLDPLSRWLSAAGFDRLMLLPIGTMSPGAWSPYSAASAMAIDPIFISVEAVEDFVRAGGRHALSVEAREAIGRARENAGVAYPWVRRAKSEALDLAFAAFVRDEWQLMTPRGAQLAAFIARERWWLDDYGLFQSIADAEGTATWRAWPAPLRDRDPRALDELRRQRARDVLRQQYLQWIASTQWALARRAARAHGVGIVGDVPFVVATDSADVWVRPGEFMLDVSAGVPPDAFSATGQDWGLPTYRWDAIVAGGFTWMRQRVKRMAALFDSVRVDHLVGFYRTFGRPPGGDGFFNPSDEGSQTWLGEQNLKIVLDSGLEVIAEDLGTVPDFVRASMARLSLPGCKVLRWERDYRRDGHPFLDPATFSPVSVTLTGTHDTESLAAWWEGAAMDERRAFVEVPSLRARGGIDPSTTWTDALRDRVLEMAYHSQSDHLFMPMQDVFGWSDRINTPATVNEINWTWRLPWPVDELAHTPNAIERARFCHALSRAAGRALPAVPA
jgi:4-alpha-glucanotransferase